MGFDISLTIILSEQRLLSNKITENDIVAIISEIKEPICKNNTMNELELADEIKNELLAEKNSYKRSSLLAKKVKDLEAAKVGANKGDKAEMQKQIAKEDAAGTGGPTIPPEMQQQQQAPLAGNPSPVPNAPVAAPMQEVVPLTAPTQRPNEPVTAGIDMGPGPGSEAIRTAPTAANQGLINSLNLLKFVEKTFSSILPP